MWWDCCVVVYVGLWVVEDQRENEGSSNLGDVEVPIGVGSICGAWMSRSIEGSICVVRFSDPLSFGYTTFNPWRKVWK
jgi:hypothetical protein